MNTLADLFEEQIKDLHNAEMQLTKALPKMAKAASNEQLKDAFTSHLEQTKEHIKRLEQVADLAGFKPTGKTCAAMKGLVEEGSEAIEEEGNESVIDGALIAAAQRVEHYEIAAYGTVRELAKRLGHADAVKLITMTLSEESAADEKLTQVAVKSIYPEAPLKDEDEEETSSEKSKSSTKRAVTK